MAYAVASTRVATSSLDWLSEECVVQVADRRLTVRGSRQPPEDDANKAIQYGRSMTFAYTGRSVVGRLPTDLWIAEILASQPDLPLATAELRERATRAGALRGIRFGVVGAGFARLRAANGDARPVSLIVSNFMTHDSSFDVQRTFVAAFRALERDANWPVIHSFGKRLSQSRMESLKRRVAAASGRAAGPGSVARLLAEEVRDVAKTDREVGKGLLVSILPRRASETAGHIVSLSIPPPQASGVGDFFLAAVSAEDPSHWYVPANEWRAVAYGPAGAAPGQVIYGTAVGIGREPPPTPWPRQR